MPYDLEAVERGHGECVATFNGHEITLRYRADLDGRALIAVKRALAGVPVLGLPGQRIPDAELVISELVRLLLPCAEAIPEYERGWDITRGGRPVPITEDELMRFEHGLPVMLLSSILADVQDPNRRRLSLAGSSVRAGSAAPAPSPTTTPSSATPSGPASSPGPSPASTTPESGSAGATGSGR